MNRPEFRGGSAIVTARAASILFAESSDARSLCTSRDEAGELRRPKLPAAKLPQLVVPTTPTTATLKAGSAMHDLVDGKRLALFDPKTRAIAFIIHPELVSTPSADLVVSAGLNTLATIVEGLMLQSGDAFSDALLMHVMRLLAQHFSFKDPIKCQFRLGRLGGRVPVPTSVGPGCPGQPGLALY